MASWGRHNDIAVIILFFRLSREGEKDGRASKQGEQGCDDGAAGFVRGLVRAGVAEHGPDYGVRKSVEEMTITAAERLGEYFRACAVNAFAEMGADRVTADAVYLLDRIAATGVDEVSERDLHVAGSRAGFKTKADLMPALHRLIDHGSVRS